MAQPLPPLFGGREVSLFSQSLETEQKQGHGATPRWRQAQNVARPMAGKATPAAASESRTILVALLWLLAFAAAELLLNQPQLMPAVPGTELRLISVPIAL